MQEFICPHNPPPLLSEQDIADAAMSLDVEVAAVKAVAEIEAPRGGFLPSGRPTILFESLQFHNRTGGRYTAAHKGISTARWVRNYLGGEMEYTRLEAAMALDRQAALKSASWGKFQIMGFNHLAAGFANVEDFVSAMVAGERAHLMAFVNVIRSWKLDGAMRAHQWAAFARAYNGPGYAQNAYDTKLAAAYERHRANSIPPT